MLLGVNMLLALLRAHFNPRYARAKMILSRAKNIFMPANINSIVILTFKQKRPADSCNFGVIAKLTCACYFHITLETMLISNPISFFVAFEHQMKCSQLINFKFM